VRAGAGRRSGIDVHDDGGGRCGEPDRRLHGARASAGLARSPGDSRYDRLDRLEDDRLYLVRGGQIEEDVPIDLAADYDASYLGALTHFLDRLDDGKPFETSAEDNLETLRIVEQVYQTESPRT
jgi:predicted dehydrogenase